MTGLKIKIPKLLKMRFPATYVRTLNFQSSSAQGCNYFRVKVFENEVRMCNPSQTNRLLRL